MMDLKAALLVVASAGLLLVQAVQGERIRQEGIGGSLRASHAATHVRAGETVHYTGAVLEYEPYNTWTEEGGGAILRENVKVIAEYAAAAKAMGADILVAPEYGLNGLDMHVLVPDELLSFTQVVPDPRDLVVPCTNDDLDQAAAIKALSCSALENQMYLVVDVAELTHCSEGDGTASCPPSGNILHNTQVVFDRNGTVIARYRKKNLFLEWQFRPGTESDDTALFATDFGVTFTLQVCFDIAFGHPGLYNVDSRGVRDVAMSTAWVDVMPFLIAPSVQNGWSRGLGVNLLVSGHHRPERSKLGSGIYRGGSDLEHDYVYDTESGSRLIVSEVQTVASANGRRPPRRPSQSNSSASLRKAQGNRLPRRDHLLYHDDLSNYTQVVLAKGDSQVVQHAEACHEDGLCCHLLYTPTGNLTYSLLSYSGTVVQGFGEYQIYAQICAVVWCRSEDVATCGQLEDGLPANDVFPTFTIYADFSVDHVYPAMFTRDLVLVENDLYDYGCDDQRSCTISTSAAVPDLMTAGFYGRWYERDP
ncbi:pantetheinase-like [Penaeus japonicus]|uniref:pantetheinase-like n=1 Tax=Penaeus japonicus TaxID=27405 RepID=UPI001C716CB4|nr:pantetheinase-like [Penaeus japonicus]